MIVLSKQRNFVADSRSTLLESLFSSHHHLCISFLTAPFARLPLPSAFSI
jgi:hypothetical protein